jgi:hypothetical protein
MLGVYFCQVYNCGKFPDESEQGISIARTGYFSSEQGFIRRARTGPGGPGGCAPPPRGTIRPSRRVSVEQVDTAAQAAAAQARAQRVDTARIKKGISFCQNGNGWPRGRCGGFRTAQPPIGQIQTGRSRHARAHGVRSGRRRARAEFLCGCHRFWSSANKPIIS